MCRRDYQPQELRQIFASHGTVCDVVVREPKRRSGGKVSKATALVVMGSAQEADRAANAVNGDVDDPLLVVPLLKVRVSVSVECVTMHGVCCSFPVTIHGMCHDFWDACWLLVCMLRQHTYTRAN